MVRNEILRPPIVSFRYFVARKAELFGVHPSVLRIKRFPILLTIKFLLLRYCDFIDRFRGLPTFIPVQETPTSYRFSGFGIMELLRIISVLDSNNRELVTLNELWDIAPGVRRYPLREGTTFYPMSLLGFQEEFKLFASLPFSEMQECCANRGGRVISVEEFLDYLIDACVRFGKPLKKIIQSMIPQISSVGVTDYIIIRCANSVHTPKRRLHIILNRRGELFISERPSETRSPDIGTLCSYRTPS